MKSLLQIEWMKVKGYRTFWVLLSLFIAAVIGINYISFNINNSIADSAGGRGNSPMSAITGTPYSYPAVWETITWMSSWLLFFPGFVIILLVSNEYTFKTHRQNVIDGLSRKQFVSTKLAVAFLLTLLSTIVVFITTIAFGAAGGSSFQITGIEAIGKFFLVSWIYILLALLLAFLVRRAVLAIGIYFIYGLIIDNVIPGLIRKNSGGKPYGSYFMPLDVADALLPFPFFRNVSAMFLEMPNVTVCMAICCGWIVFYHWFTNRKFQGEDL